MGLGIPLWIWFCGILQLNRDLSIYSFTHTYKVDIHYCQTLKVYSSHKLIKKTPYDRRKERNSLFGDTKNTKVQVKKKNLYKKTKRKDRIQKEASGSKFSW